MGVDLHPAQHRPTRVCLIVDNPLRDLDGLALVGWHLAISGHEVYLVPMYDQASEVFALQPDVVVVNYARSTNKARMAAYARAGIFVCVLDTEGGVVDSLEDYASSVKRNGTSDLIDLMLVWGPLQRDAFVEFSGIPADRVELVGCPRMDFCSPPWVEALPQLDDIARPMVLINTNFSLVNPRFSRNLRAELETTLAAGFSNWNRDYIDRLAAETSAAMHGVISAAREIARKLPDIHFVLRPHPFEDPARYEGAFEEVENLEVRLQGSVITWINRSDAVLHLNCGTAIETVLMNKPAISLEWLNTEALIANAPFPREISYLARNIDDVANFLEGEGHKLSRNGEQQDKVGKVRQWFANGDGQAAKRAAAEIGRRIESRSIRTSARYCKRMGLIGGRAERPMFGMLDTFAKTILKANYPRVRDTVSSITSTGRARRAKTFSVTQVREIVTRISEVAGCANRPGVESAAENRRSFPSRAMTAIRIAPPPGAGSWRPLPVARKAAPETEQAIGRLLTGYFPRGLYFNSSTHRQFLRDLNTTLEPGSRVLDLGSGQSFRYEEFFRSLGVEWHPADLFECPERPEYGRVTTNRIPFPDAHFDAVVCMNVIEHFEDPQAMIGEISRVVRDGGIVAGACAFHEMEHDSYWHLSRAGLETLLQRYDFFPYYVQPSEYSGAVLAAQRHFGGGGRIATSDRRSHLLTLALGLLNSVPFLVANLLEWLRRVSPMFDPFQDCATLFFIATRARRPVAASGSRARILLTNDRR
jgi:surface carbohydrate biosynthesis protein